MEPWGTNSSSKSNRPIYLCYNTYICALIGDLIRSLHASYVMLVIQEAIVVGEDFKVEL